MVKKTSSKKKSTILNESDFMDRLLALPSAVFNRMIMKSGLPTEEARELCAVHRALSQ